MKVLILTNMYPSHQKPYAGIFVKNQYEELKRCCPKHLTIEILSMERSFTGVLGSLYKYLKFLVRFLPKLFRKYDVLHLHSFYPLFPLLVLYKIFHRSARIIVTVHGSDIKIFGVRKNIYSMMSKWGDLAIGVGQAVSQEMRENFRFRTVMTLCAGISEDKFYKIKECRKKYDFIFVGSFYEIKGLPLLLEALVGMPELRLCFIGSGPLENKLADMAVHHEIKILNHANQDELREYYNKAKFLVLPSQGEAFGLVVSEAMYCGTPVLVSDRAGVNEQVIDGFNGYILEAYNGGALKGMMEFCMNITCEKYSLLSANALASNREHSLKEVCNSLLKQYMAME